MLQKRALVKVYVVSGVLIFGLYQGNYLETNWISQPGNEKIIATIIFSQTLILAFICVPGKRSDNLLRVGEGRTKSFAIMSILSLLILILVTSMVLRQTGELASGNRYIEESLWLTASFVIMVSFTQLLPRYGFDAAADPEYWWLQFAIVLSGTYLLVKCPRDFYYTRIMASCRTIYCSSKHHRGDAKPLHNLDWRYC